MPGRDWPGVFIVFEGSDGAGKTTQLQMLHEALVERGYLIVCSREPGGTVIGEAIREILHARHHTEMDPGTSLFLFSGSRRQLVVEVLAPALAKENVVVLLDRYWMSTIAYQSRGGGVDHAEATVVTNIACGDYLVPDLVIYIDITAEVGQHRQRIGAQKEEREWNRWDEKKIDYHRRTREAYLKMARANPDWWASFDGLLHPEELHQQILERVLTLLQKQETRAGWSR